MSTHEDKTNDFNFDHDGLANEDTEEDNAAGPLMDHANPLYSPPAPSVDIDANIIPLTGAWTALANATSDWDVEGLSARYRPSSPVWRYRKRIPCLCSSRMRRWLCVCRWDDLVSGFMFGPRVYWVLMRVVVV